MHFHLHFIFILISYWLNDYQNVKLSTFQCPVIAKQMERFNRKSGRSWKLGRVSRFKGGGIVLIGGVQKVFIFKGDCPNRGDKFSMRLIPLCILWCRKGQSGDGEREVFTQVKWGAYFNILGGRDAQWRQPISW